MDPADALAELGLAPGDDATTVRRAYHRLLRERHPDLAAGTAAREADVATARLIEAYELVMVLVGEAADGLVPTPVAQQPDATTTRGDATGTVDLARHDVPAVDADDEDSLLVDAPPDLTWQLLVDAAARVGDIAYIDRSLQILEIVVRFEGGPSCSVVFTLQGRGQHTEIMCSMASIEAGPTPPIAPVVDALVEALTALG